MDFSPTSEEIDKASVEDGAYIFKYLRKKYPDKNIKDADIVFNSLMYALLCHRLNFADHDHKLFKQLVNTVLDRN